MHEPASLAGITFTENGPIDVTQLNALYRLIGWDSHHRRTDSETTEMLRVSHYYIAAHTADGQLGLWRSVRGPGVRCPYAPGISPARDCDPVYAWRADTPATLQLCVGDLDRWQWHSRLLSTVWVSRRHRCRPCLGARDRGHQQRGGQREIGDTGMTASPILALTVILRYCANDSSGER
jgi:hypothetical protein